MSRARAPSLQHRLLALVLGLVAAVWVATAVTTWLDVRHELDELLDGHLAQAAALLVAQQSRELDDDDHAVDAPALHRYAPKVVFQVFHEGRPVLRSAHAPAAPLVDPSRPLRSGFADVSVDGTRWRVFAARGAERDVQVYVGEQWASRTAIVWAALRGTLWPMLLALPLLALAVWWAVRRGLAPLRSLGTQIAAREPQALDPVQLDAAPAEMRPMVDALNALFARIGGLLDAERRFTADAAHELRTPIAAIRAHAEVALGEADEAARRHALQSTLEGCDRAARLVEQLLTLARLEAQGAAAHADVDLAAVARRVVADAAPRALARRQSLDFEADDACTAAGDETLLSVLVRNLVDNALRYAPDRARIEVRVRRRDAQILLTVEDSGPGLGSAQRARLGERFFRPPGQQASGSGLGWSIVRRIAQAHGFDVELGESARLGGLRASVRAPARDAQMRPSRSTTS